MMLLLSSASEYLPCYVVLYLPKEHWFLKQHLFTTWVQDKTTQQQHQKPFAGSRVHRFPSSIASCAWTYQTSVELDNTCLFVLWRIDTSDLISRSFRAYAWIHIPCARVDCYGARACNPFGPWQWPEYQAIFALGEFLLTQLFFIQHRMHSQCDFLLFLGWPFSLNTFANSGVQLRRLGLSTGDLPRGIQQWHPYCDGQRARATANCCQPVTCIWRSVRQLCDSSRS